MDVVHVNPVPTEVAEDAEAAAGPTTTLAALATWRLRTAQAQRPLVALQEAA